MQPLVAVHPTVAQARDRFHPDTIATVRDAVARDRVVIVGMAGNPFVRKARNLLTERGTAFTYLEFGGYLSQWKPRLALKMWAGWPTFPMVFVGGMLVGGFKDLEALAQSGELDTLLAGGGAQVR